MIGTLQDLQQVMFPLVKSLTKCGACCKTKLGTQQGSTQAHSQHGMFAQTNTRDFADIFVEGLSWQQPYLEDPQEIGASIHGTVPSALIAGNQSTLSITFK